MQKVNVLICLEWCLAHCVHSSLEAAVSQSDLVFLLFQKDEENRRLEEKRKAEEERHRLEKERREREMQEAALRERRFKERANEIDAQK